MISYLSVSYLCPFCRRLLIASAIILVALVSVYEPQFFLCDAKFYLPGQEIRMRDNRLHWGIQMSSTQVSQLSTMEELINMLVVQQELLVRNSNTILTSSTISNSSTQANSSSMILTNSTINSSSSNSTWIKEDILSQTQIWAWCLLAPLELLASQVNNRWTRVPMSPPTTERWSSESTKLSSSSQVLQTITPTQSREETLWVKSSAQGASTISMCSDKHSLWDSLDSTSLPFQTNSLEPKRPRQSARDSTFWMPLSKRWHH